MLIEMLACIGVVALVVWVSLSKATKRRAAHLRCTNVAVLLDTALRGRQMKTIWLWSGLWKVGLAVAFSSALSFGLALLLEPGAVGAAVLGLSLGIPTGFVAPQIWPCWRFE